MRQTDSTLLRVVLPALFLMASWLSTCIPRCKFRSLAYVDRYGYALCGHILSMDCLPTDQAINWHEARQSGAFRNGSGLAFDCWDWESTMINQDEVCPYV